VSSLDNLLGLQEIDTALDQLRHRHTTLPERAALQSAQDLVASCEAVVAATFAELSGIRSAEKVAEDEASSIEAKAAEVERLTGELATLTESSSALEADAQAKAAAPHESPSLERLPRDAGLESGSARTGQWCHHRRRARRRTMRHRHREGAETAMSNPDFARMVPGFDFLQGLMKGAGASLPGMSQWIAPTLDADEVDKRIQELRTVQFWLEQNARMLAATIQALEVQRMTLATLRTMNVPSMTRQ